MARRALIFQHMQGDGPGRFSALFADAGISTDTVHLHEGEQIPGLAGYDLLFVLGGAQDTWQEYEHPWLVAEKQAIREWVSQRAKPYIGICLGHQLLADALGGSVSRASQKEVGLHEITLGTERQHIFFEGLSGSYQVMQWHLAEIADLPADAVNLASSNATAFQALAVNEHALGVQFHFEWTPEVMRNWPESWKSAFDDERGEGAFSKVLEESAPHMSAYAKFAETIFCNFRKANGL